MVNQWDGLYMLGTLEGKGLTELLLTTRNFSPVFSEEFGNLYYCIHYCSECKNVRLQNIMSKTLN